MLLVNYLHVDLHLVQNTTFCQDKRHLYEEIGVTADLQKTCETLEIQSNTLGMLTENDIA